MMTKPKLNNNKQAKNRRSAARLAAVQALYELDFVNANVNLVLEYFLAKRWPLCDSNSNKDLILIEPDREWLKVLVKGVTRSRTELDTIIEPALNEKWTIDRLETLLRVILQSAVYELNYKPNIPASVIINEYLDVTHAFFEGPEKKLVNGVLDRLARDLRTEEL